MRLARLWVLASLCLAGVAYAQGPPSMPCSVNAGVPPLMRQSGMAELISDIVIQCTGGAVPSPGTPNPQINVVVTLNASVTSRLFPGQLLEALLLVDDPAAASQFPCTAGPCTNNAGQPFGPGAGQNRNVFQASLLSANALIFTGVPMQDPGAGTRVFRIKNVRVNASQLPSAAQLTATVTIQNAPAHLVLGANVVTAGFVQTAMAFSVSDTSGNPESPLPISLSRGVNLNNGLNSTSTLTFNMQYTEAFATAFKRRNVASTAGSPTLLASQAAPATVLTTETGFYNAAFPATNGLNQAGLATNGTRFVARFTNVPAGVSLFVTLRPILAGTSSTGVTARLIAGDANGFGAYIEIPPAATIAGGIQVSPVGLAGGNGISIWEVLDPSDNFLESVSFGVVVSYAANQPGLGQAFVSGTLAPTSTSPAASMIDPLPRFTDVSFPSNVFTIVAGAPAILAATLPNGNLNAAYPFTSLTGLGGSPPYFWTVALGALPPGLTLSTTGILSGVPTAIGTFFFTVRVLDTQQLTAFREFAVVILPPSLTILQTATPVGVVGAPYPATVFTATGGSPPYLWTTALGALPPGMSLSATGVLGGTPTSSGQFVFTVVLRDSGGSSSTRSAALLINPLLAIVTQPPLALGMVGAPYQQMFAANGGQPPYEWSVAGGLLPPGILLAPGNGVLTGTPTSAGESGFTIQVKDAGGRSASRPYSLSIASTASGPDQLGPVPDNLFFPFVPQSGPATRQLRVVHKGAGTATLNAVARTDQGGQWLFVSPGSAPSSASGAAAFTITANASGLARNTYTGRVVVTSSVGGPEIVVPVTMTVANAQQLIALAPTGLTFTAVQGGPSPLAQNLAVANGGVGVLSWNATATTLSGDLNLISFAPAGGSSDAGGTNAPALEVRVNSSSLAPGEYYARMDINSAGAANSPQSATIVVNVLPADANPGPVLQPTGVAFNSIVGGRAPDAQEVVLYNPTRTPVTFFSSRFTADGSPWFTYTPDTGTLSPGTPLRIRVQPDVTGLTVGIRRGNLNLTFSDGSSRILDLLAVVGPAPRLAAPDPEVTRAAAGCTPTQLASVFTALGIGFSVPAGWPTPVEVRVFDDCGDPMTQGSVVVTFSNNDAPISLVPLGEGRWSGTWVARNTQNSQTTVTVTAENPALGIRGTYSIAGGLRANLNPPIVAPGGVVSAASFRARAPLAPGGLVSVFGTRLGDALVSAQTLPLATLLGNTSVTLAGRSLPLLFSSDGQVNAVVPFDLVVDTPQHLLVRRGTSYSVPETVAVAAAQPSVFTKDQSGRGQGVIVDTQFRFVEPGNAIARRGVIIIYCTGLGGVTPAVAAGAEAPGNPLSVLNATLGVTIGGANAEVLFAGLAPGFAGLYQVNAVVPDAAPSGGEVPVVLTVGGQSSAPVTMAVQ